MRKLLVACAVVCLLAVTIEGRAGRWARDEDEVLEAKENEADENEVENEDGNEAETDIETTVEPVTESKYNDSIQCEPYRYCDGTSFESRVVVKERAVKCDLAPDPTERCCLPYAAHLVCYNIVMEGQYLNYDRDDYMKTTDFSGLCQAMAESQGRKYGTHSGVSLAKGTEGKTIFRYGDWIELDEAGTEQIQDLSCEVSDIEPTVTSQPTDTNDID